MVTSAPLSGEYFTSAKIDPLPSTRFSPLRVAGSAPFAFLDIKELLQEGSRPVLPAASPVRGVLVIVPPFISSYGVSIIRDGACGLVVARLFCSIASGSA